MLMRTHVLPNTRSTARRARGTNALRCVWLVGVLALATSCLADPHRAQSVDLLEHLTAARGIVADQPSRADEACNMVGDVQTRLFGEPGLVDVQPAWSQLRDAAGALQAVCGQTALLAQPSTESPAMVQARARWQAGIQREMALACDHLRQAAVALGRGSPC
jgi:hypothetical protein